MRHLGVCLLFALLAAGCSSLSNGFQFTGPDWTDFIKESDGTWGKYGDPKMTPSPESLRAIILKNQTLGFTRFPVGYWTYLDYDDKQVANHITKKEVADWDAIGATIMKGPEWNPDNPVHHKKMMALLDWCQKYNIKLMIRDSRTFLPENGRPSRIKEVLNDVAKHPAFFSFHVCDEPHALDTDNNGPARHSAFIADNVPNGRPYVNCGGFTPGVEGFLGVKKYTDYIDLFAEQGKVDFLAFDTYTQMWAGQVGWNGFFANLRLFREGSWRHGLPFWITPLCVGHFDYQPPTFDDLRWQFNSSIASGATGVLWYFYYMRNPHNNYINPPVDEFWEKTQTWHDMRKIHQAFHRQYGDLFLRLASTRVTFVPHAYGGGMKFKGNEMVEAVIAPNDPDAPGLVGEFIGLEGNRYIMIVNLHPTKSVWWTVKYPGDDIAIYSYGWDGKEHEGADSSASRYQHGKLGNIGVGYWLRPGQAAVQRVDSTAIRRSALVVKMRELNGMPPQPPRAVELVADAQARVDSLNSAGKDANDPEMKHAVEHLQKMQAKLDAVNKKIAEEQAKK